MSRRVGGGDDRIQAPAGALGRGFDPGFQENPPKGGGRRRSSIRKNGGLFSPDGKPQLSADDRAFRFADASHDYSLLPGMVPDALHRPAPVHGFDVLHFQFLSGFAEGTVSETLAAIAPLPAIIDGSGNRADGHQYACRARSPGRQADRLRPYSEVPRRIEEGQGRREEIPQAAGMGSLDPHSDRNLFRAGGLLRHRQRELLHGSIPSFFPNRVFVHRTVFPSAGAGRRTLLRLRNPPQTIPRPPQHSLEI